MKKRIIFAVLLVLAVVGVNTMPKMVESTIPTVYYITPNLKTYENVITASGTVQSENVRQIYLQSAMVASDVFVSVGDTVKEGDLLLQVDGEKTGKMGLPISLIRDISDDMTTNAVNGIDWASLASAYGLSAVVSGGSGASAIDADMLSELLGDSGLLTSVDSGTIVDELVDDEITAPIAGVVTEVGIQKDVPAAAGKPIITIADNRNYKVLVSIREEDIGRIQVGDAANVRGVGFSGATYRGTITKVYPTARKTLSGTTSETVVDAEITLENPDKRLKPGFTAKVEILGGSDYNLITVPYEAIKQDENNNEYVYLYQNGKLKKQLVTTGQEMTDEVEILDGVSHDSVVVYNPSDEIKEGAMIQIKGRADVG